MTTFCVCLVAWIGSYQHSNKRLVRRLVCFLQRREPILYIGTSSTLMQSQVIPELLNYLLNPVF